MMMEFMGPTRLIGDYIVGPKIGSGSFAVVYRSTHRHTGLEYAIKEIHKKQLSPKVNESLFKEISILSTINHPNIIRLFQTIQTNDRIYLVLEYCGGGDLGAYIHRHGKVSEATARHFMTQLAAGLQVLQEKHLIHRDLKPQNLLLTSTSATPLLKIGDFGFARSLTPQGLAETLCGSPLYMAPEIIQNYKYDAKADLWSVGAILFQLVTGRPPFQGNSQYELFQNILKSTELRFPPSALKELHSDCLDLCRSLLRQNPVERLTFKEFFNHNFLQETRSIMHVEQPSLHPPVISMVQQVVISATDKVSQSHYAHRLKSFLDDSNVDISPPDEIMLFQRSNDKRTACGKSALELSPTIVSDKLGKCIHDSLHFSKQPEVSDLMESIERGYVLVDSHSESLEALSDFFDASLQDNSTSRVSIYSSKGTNMEIGFKKQINDPSSCYADGLENSKGNEAEELVSSSAFVALSKVHWISSPFPSNRIKLLHLYVQILAELSHEKYNAEMYLESFAIKLVVLAIWKNALETCNSWVASNNKGLLHGKTSTNESKIPCGSENVCASQNTEQKINFSDPSSVFIWVKQEFIVAIDCAETLSCHIQNMDAKMPDAMEIIFQKALLFGTNGAVAEYMENRDKAAESYSKAMLLLSFIVEEAENLPLNPSFSLTSDTKNRILQYILNLKSHQKTLSGSSSKDL
ncbi:putative protein kinase Group-Pl-3 family [Lupinus albus]|uniref:Protein kinase domain-containing protein n=1 Tax=Lupinus albus TaxID=3870 RepID=A0A6A4P3Q6_LUPAL|nr:putative protein kinase Group-Pl-3 family [Lupinus albus]